MKLKIPSDQDIIQKTRHVLHKYEPYIDTLVYFTLGLCLGYIIFF